jgi:hypothetical protein
MHPADMSIGLVLLSGERSSQSKHRVKLCMLGRLWFKHDWLKWILRLVSLAQENTINPTKLSFRPTAGSGGIGMIARSISPGIPAMFGGSDPSTSLRNTNNAAFFVFPTNRRERRNRSG